MPKKITKNQQTGRTGEVFVGYLFQKLGHIWHESKSDAGIDCHVEWRRSDSGETTNRHIGVQVKAYSGAFNAETNDSFEFLPSEDDVDYWMHGTMPVILVCCKPWAEEAYWINIRGYFSDPDRRRSRKIVFHKKETRLDEGALPQLEKLALPTSLGLYLGAPPRREILYSNLVRVSRVPNKVYIGVSEFRKRKQIFAVLRENGTEHPQGEFICREENIISVHDLRLPPWETVVDATAVEVHPFEQWWREDIDKRRNYAVELLNHCLTAFFQNKGVRWRASDEVFFFKSNPGQREIVLKTRGIRQRTSHTVFKVYLKRASLQTAFCRHHAIKTRFHEFDGDWYLEITPTYRFTRDGWKEDRFAAARLKKIKEFEGNPGVFGNAYMWATYMTDTVTDFYHEAYTHLAFADLVTFEVSKGIPDDAWRASALEAKTVDEAAWETLIDE
jgi:uncharacterized protein DUF4365